eukprot:SAG31_NODE_2567_length_5464_cov_2.804660_6_plen_36_part_00
MSIIIVITKFTAVAYFVFGFFKLRTVSRDDLWTLL